jgi:hypothetical protein
VLATDFLLVVNIQIRGILEQTSGDLQGVFVGSKRKLKNFVWQAGTKVCMSGWQLIMLVA